MGRRAAGFTLLEILLVISLMALFAGVYLGGIGAVLPFEIRSASRTLAGDLGYASQRAAMAGDLHRWVVDLDAQVFRLERLVREPRDFGAELATHSDLLDLAPPIEVSEFRPVENRYGDWRRLKGAGVWIARVRVGDDEVEEGVIGIRFAPDGGADPAKLLLEDDGGRRFAVRVLAFTSEIRVDELPDA